MIQENLKKGLLTEMKCQMFCIEQGWGVSVPIAEMRYDFILDKGDGVLLKIQVKTCRLKSDEKAIAFNCKSTHAVSKGNKIKPYDKSQIDYYMTCWNENFYLIPVEKCGTSEKSLRIVPADTPSAKTQSTMACDFLIKEVVKSI